ncbi:MAG: DNA methyltransferase [Victivallales bacterium]
MKTNSEAVRKCLKSFDFNTLFLEHLGWDKHQAQLEIPMNGSTVNLTAIAQKRGFVAYICKSILDRPTRLKIDHQVTKSVREHFVIYADKPSGQQVWHWVRREPGKPLASRDHRFHVSQSGDHLIQRLELIAVNMQEEEVLTLPDITGRNREAFDVDKITKKFYERFKAEHAAFLKFIKGFPPPAKVDGKLEPHPDLQWYTSLMLNRLMFVYFIQKKGFLDEDTDYLRNRLSKVRQTRGEDNFHSFYRYFLLRLFHDGLGKSSKERKLDPALEKLIGNVPYLNGGFFEEHKLEAAYTIEIPDEAFEKLFDFFEYADKANGVRWNWHLDERALRADNEINPDVVGYIFEKYINQKQMGAYYTKEDITEYISKNTIIPFLFDAARKKCDIAFKPGSAMWRLLQDDPDRYIYPAVGHGITCDYDRINHRDHKRRTEPLSLPAEIEEGVKDVSKREGWNKPAPEDYALPTETWREVLARRQRCLEIREKLIKGEVQEINDLITLNLDIWQFARDAIVNSEGPELLRAFWYTIAGRQPEKSNDKFEPGITILDPTCGSGAFLFAALRILETLYSDCLERMERFVEDIADKKHHPKQFSDFKDVLAGIGRRRDERYFILKSIIINNLFGVDLMEEAVEICKLRLFLKLVAQVETVDQIEPLPDIDFNIRAGNTLVGFTKLSQIRDVAEHEKMEGGHQQGMLGFQQDAVSSIEEDAELVESAFKMFRRSQVEANPDPETKRNLLKRLAKLDEKLDRYLASEYDVDVNKQKNYDAWKASHQPFHWFVEFYGIMHAGGFDVIIGNPPYVEYSKVRGSYSLRSEYTTLSCGNIYTCVVERSFNLAMKWGRIGVIIPLSLSCTSRTEDLREAIARFPRWISCYDMRPSSLFEGVSQRLSIMLAGRETHDNVLHTGGYRRWSAEERPVLIPLTRYTTPKLLSEKAFLPKFDTEIESKVLEKLDAPLLERLVSENGSTLYIHRIVRYFVKALNFLPTFKDAKGKAGKSEDYKVFHFDPKQHPQIAAMLNSTLFYWFWRTHCDGFHCGYTDVFSMPFKLVSENTLRVALSGLLEKLMDEMKSQSTLKKIKTKAGHITYQEFYPSSSKVTLDQIDRILAKHYGFTEEELDFIINYDIKYRMGGADGDEEED